jgi:hypothetical protein
MINCELSKSTNNYDLLVVETKTAFFSSKGANGTTGDQPKPDFCGVVRFIDSSTGLTVNCFPKTEKMQAWAQVNRALSTSVFADSAKARVKEFAALQPGWLDGDGEAFPDNSEAWLLENFVDLPFLTRPGLSPTEDGELRVEWSIGDWEASAQINLSDHTVWWHALNVLDTRQEQDEEFLLASSKDWERLCSLANFLVTV